MNLSYLLLTADRWGFAAMKQLLSLTWQIALLFAAAMIAAYLLKRTSARIRHSLWAAVFVLIPVTALLVYAAGNLHAPRIEVEIMPSYVTTEPVLTIPSEVSVSEQPPIPTAPSMPASEPVKQSSYPWLLVWALYSLGAAMMLMLVLYGRLKMEYIKRRGLTVTDQRIVAVLKTVRDELGISRPVALVESPSITAPLTIGTVHPVILMPDGFAECLSDADLRAFAIHELGHVKRFDSLLLMYVSVVRALLYFNPLVWFAARQVSVTAEHACDDLVVDSAAAPLDYAELLVRIARALPHRELTTELAAGFIISKHHFLRRVEEILADRKDRITRLSKKALAGCVLMAIAVVLLIVAVPVAEVQELDSGEQISERVDRIMKEWIDIVTAEPTTTISGRVLDPEGNPIADATVAPVRTGDFSFTGDTRFDVRSRNDGRYVIKLPPSLNHEFNLVAHDGGVLSFRTWGNGVSRAFTTTDGQQIDDMDITLTRPGIVSGEVVDPDGNPAAGHEVKAVTFDGYSNDIYAPSTETDEQGGFEITHVRPGTVMVITPGMTPSESFIHHAPDTVYEIVDVFPGQTTSGIELTGYGRDGILDAMEPPSEEFYNRTGELNQGFGTFRARIINDKTGEPFPRLTIRYYTAANQTSAITFDADLNGLIELPGVKLGVAQFSAMFENGAGRWYSKDSVQIEGPINYGHFEGTVVTRLTKPGTNPLAFEVTEDMEPVTIRVEPTMIVTGVVYDPEGKPVAGATVAPARSGSGNSITGDTRFSVITDEDGKYTMYLPDSGGNEYNLVAHDGDYMENRTWANGVTEPMKSKSGEWLNGLDITLTRPAVVRGIVVDTSGNPMPDQQVMVTGCDGLSNRYYEPEAVTDENGEFELTFIRPGEVWVATPAFFIMSESQRNAFPEESRQRVTVHADQPVENIRLVGYTQEERVKYRKSGGLIQFFKDLF